MYKMIVGNSNKVKILDLVTKWRVLIHFLSANSELNMPKILSSYFDQNFRVSNTWSLCRCAD